MSFVSNYNVISVASTPTLIIASNPERKGFMLANAGTSTVYIGMDANVTTSNGFPILSNAYLSSDDLDGVWKGAVYGIVSSTSQNVNYWEFGA